MRANWQVSAEDTVLAMWRALSARDWDGVKPHLAADCIYVDMPVGPAAAARGPDDIVKRIKVGLEPLSDYHHHGGLLVADGDNVMYEHSETWTWPTGETAVLRFVTVHEVLDGRITRWKDYWDMGALTSFAPPNWLADLASADMSWIYDATDQL